MIRTLTVAQAATLAGTSATAVRTMCRSGAVAAAKVRGRWRVETSSLLHRLNRPTRRPADRLRAGEARTERAGRAARARAGHHMSVARRHAVLDALCTRANGGRATAAAFRGRTGADPARDCLARVGRQLVACFSYAMCDLFAAARAYGRTAGLLAA